MSVTFSPITVPNAVGDLGRTDGDDVPDVNLANANARDLLCLLGLGDDLYGEVPHDQLPDLQRRIIRLVYYPQARAHLITDPREEEPGHAGVAVVEDAADGVVRIERRGCRVLHGGNTDQQTLRRLRALQRVVAWAQKAGVGICWG